ncbi:MAG: hypothetical protein JWP87_5048 [Labilithrix sp.]|nr:hypothetical protein [Labilithrix sp.]
MRAARVLAFVTTAAVSYGAFACVREGAPVVAPVEVTAETADGGAVPLYVTAPPPVTRDRCTARLRPSPIKTREGCTLDERLSHGNGTLLYPCAGDGPVEAVFAEHRFQGRITGTAVVLALTTELDWDDGCHWETKQGIRGDWKRDGTDAGKHPKLAWSYSEAPVSGTGCFGACTAKADIDVDDLQP